MRDEMGWVEMNLRWERCASLADTVVRCAHAGTYADDCLCERVSQHKCYVVATCDKELRRRLRKLPGVPIMYISRHQYSIERMPEATVGGAPIK